MSSSMNIDNKGKDILIMVKDQHNYKMISH